MVGAGPAGLSYALLVAADNRVTVFERDRKPGGFLRYGIPDFKLEKPINGDETNVTISELRPVQILQRLV